MGNICHIDFTFRGKEKIGIDLDSNANLDEKLKSIRKFLANSKGERSPLTNDDDRISIIYRNKGRVYELDLYVYMSYDIKKMKLSDISGSGEVFPDSITTISPWGEYVRNYETVQYIDIEKKDRIYKFFKNRTSIDKKYGIWVDYKRLPYSVIPSEGQKEGDLSEDVRRVRKSLEKNLTY